LFAKSLEIALEDYSDIESFQSLKDISQIIPVIQEEKPDITLIDINLSNISSEDGLVLARNVLKIVSNTKIVILTGYDLPVYRYEAQKIGAKGFINKNIEPDKLFEILLKIQNGKTYFPSSVDYIEELTNIEKQILQLLCNGHKREEIANILYASKRTISNHIQHIFDKLDVSSSLQAVTKGIQLGYIQANYKSK
jgi:two-component system secretion system response regulator SalR